MTSDTVTPASRREVFLRIALAVAKDGLPEPQSLRFNVSTDGQRQMVSLALASHAAATAWAKHLGVADQMEVREYGPPTVREPIRTLATAWRSTDGFPGPGWTVYVEADEPAEPAATTELAAEVTAAIEGAVTA